MKARWWLVSGGVIVVAGSAYIGSQLLSTQVISDNAGIRLRSYRQITNALATGGKPEAWDAAVFMSQAMAGRMADTLKGTQISLGPKEQPTVVLTLGSMSLSGDVGMIRAKLVLTGTHVSSGVPFTVDADADFVVEAIETDPDPDHADGVILLMEPRITSLTPGLAAPWTMIRANSAISELMALGIDAKLREQLKVKVPIRRSFDYATTINAKHEVPVNDQTKLTLEISSAGEKLHTDIIYRPIVTPAGLWALGVVASSGAANTAIDRDEAITDAQKASLDAMRTTLTSKLTPFAARPTELAVYVGASIFSKLTTAFNALAPATRAVNVRSTAISGDLFQKRWRDDVLGEGGVFISLTNADAVRAVITPGNIQSAWDGQKGQQSIGLPLDISTQADIHVHVDPLIGGGAGTSVGMKGHFATTMRASVGVQRIALGAQSGVFLVPDLACQSGRLNVVTDGNLEIGPLKTSVPPIGANMSMVVGKEQIKPSPILTSLPTVYPMPQIKAAPPSPGSAGTSQILPRGIQIVFSDLSASYTSQGTWIGANAAITDVSIGSKDPNALTPNTLADQAKDLLARARPACDLKPDVEMVVGTINIGENNDFLQGIAEVSKGVQNVQKAALKAVEDTARALEKARRDTQATVIKAAEDAKREADKFIEQRKRDAENAEGWFNRALGL